ncbi:MAG: SCO family protein [Chitinophagales bacterium]|nr:SCO family protein [Chitinophagales bacterium]
MHRKIKQFLVLTKLIGAFFFLLQCNSTQDEKISVKRVINGKIVEDSLLYVLPEFSLISHTGDTINQNKVLGKWLVVDFFFTNCPSICPKMKAQILRVYEKFKGRDDFLILSVSIDPQRDTVEALRNYATKLGINNNWYFLTGNKGEIYNTADKMLIAAEEDPESPGGFAHSGNFILIDPKGRIRGYYDGTNPSSVDKLINEIEKVLTM